MWETINFMLLLFEVFVIFAYARCIYKKKPVNHSLAILVVFIINFLLHLVPYFYSVTELGISNNSIYDVFECLSGAVRNFVGEVTTPIVVDYGKRFSVFSVVYSIGTLLAMGTAISTMLSIFNNNLLNKARVLRILNSKSCNIIIGNKDFYDGFARQNPNTIVMVSPDLDSDEVKEMIEHDYIVLSKNFSLKFLESKYINKKTRYNVICSCEYEEFLEYLDDFILFKKRNNLNSNVYMYIEVEERKLEITMEELIANSGCAEYISLFSREELIARSLVDDYSIAKYMPRDFLNTDTSLKNDADIRVFMFGYGNLSKKIYKYFLLNNHFVTYNNGYHPFPIKYYIYGDNADAEEWNINGIKDALNLLNQDDYLPFPEFSYETHCNKHIPYSHNELLQLKNTITTEKTFNYIVIDLEDIYDSLEYALQIKKLLNNSGNYKIFVNAKPSFLKGHSEIVCYGETDQILTEDIIINESMLHIAKAINESYIKIRSGTSKSDSDSANSDLASELWKKLDYYSAQSNICAAMGLRVKLNLLELDCVNDGKRNNLDLIEKKYPYELGSSTLESRSQQNLQNAMRAQEHSRWTTFHLLSKWLPMRKDEITFSSSKRTNPEFVTKNRNEKRHACITTLDGLATLSEHLAERASEKGGKTISAKEYEYFKNDDMLLINSSKILSRQGFSVVECISISDDKLQAN